MYVWVCFNTDILGHMSESMNLLGSTNWMRPTLSVTSALQQLLKAELYWNQVIRPAEASLSCEQPSRNIIFWAIRTITRHIYMCKPCDCLRHSSTPAFTRAHGMHHTVSLICGGSLLTSEDGFNIVEAVPFCEVHLCRNRCSICIIHQLVLWMD